MIHALLPLFADPECGILCGLDSAYIGLPQSSAYAASKVGLLSLARTLSGQLKECSIRVNGLSHGLTATRAFSKLSGEAVAEAALREEIRGLVPIGCKDSPLKFAKTAVFFASDESAFTVGTELLVDGDVGSF